jgi:hypothetical protein
MRAMGNTLLMIQSYMSAFHKDRQLGERFLSMHNLDFHKEWSPIDDIIGSLSDTERRVGGNTVRRIGRNISANLHHREAICSVKEFARYMNEMYRQNHTSLGQCLQVKEEKTGTRLIFNDNPYPFAFNLGLIEGFFTDLHLFYDIKVREQEQSIIVMNT